MKNLNNIDKNTSPEIRAFIYQQLTDLENFLPHGAAISITVEDKSLLAIPKTAKTKTSLKKIPATKMKAKKVEPKKVVIYIETSIGNLIAEAKNKDIFAAIQAAKENLKDQLAALQGVLIRPEDRANSIETIMRHPYLH